MQHYDTIYYVQQSLFLGKGEEAHILLFFSIESVFTESRFSLVTQIGGGTLCFNKSPTAVDLEKCSLNYTGKAQLLSPWWTTFHLEADLKQWKMREWLAQGEAMVKNGWPSQDTFTQHVAFPFL